MIIDLGCPIFSLSGCGVGACDTRRGDGAGAYRAVRVSFCAGYSFRLEKIFADRLVRF